MTSTPGNDLRPALAFSPRLSVVFGDFSFAGQSANCRLRLAGGGATVLHKNGADCPHRAMAPIRNFDELLYKHSLDRSMPLTI
jgi:hypothetical protein